MCTSSFIYKFLIWSNKMLLFFQCQVVPCENFLLWDSSLNKNNNCFAMYKVYFTNEMFLYLKIIGYPVWEMCSCANFFYIFTKAALTLTLFWYWCQCQQYCCWLINLYVHSRYSCNSYDPVVACKNTSMTHPAFVFNEATGYSGW